MDDDRNTMNGYTPSSTADYGSLSEGELPVNARRRRSVGETQFSDKTTSSINRSTSAEEKMEDALRAIGMELSRCRHLLQKHNSRESKQSEAASLTERDRALPLHKCDANRRISGASPNCVFTLHVGTVLLSDQALVSSRNKQLALTWQFYDQAPTMTHLLAARVMLFNFSVEYDVRLTEQFLSYLKHEEMPIIVYEINKQDRPLAKCLLPLRDFLLHTNRRVDMSLALIAGGNVKSVEAIASEMNMDEEVGVVDVWCLLGFPASVVAEPPAQLPLPQPIPQPSLGSEKRKSYRQNIFDLVNSGKKWRRASKIKTSSDTQTDMVTILPQYPEQVAPTDRQSRQSEVRGQGAKPDTGRDDTVALSQRELRCDGRPPGQPALRRLQLAGPRRR
ncbi:X-linked retinitis pigmentosa GTPase regulator-interacting protein 1-like isoform X3 [Leptidea sinapis]|uniref:X-linked retinitis pigmentosa GTPase regulator-interacting protein 1-like isoform X3 n=1 Tax=Leptidea sinapis TaxID=189913 RepID=UPI0021C2723E|nr:X-linked retinitis pigmentosa GTPase regulator-interacting protein 1-like isoform X3 [Leptidea sinapis]